MRYWFKGKRYGYGWYPATWQAWLIVIVYLVALALFIRHCFSFGDDFDVWLYIGGVFSLTGALVYISWKKGEPTHWRWGK